MTPTLILFDIDGTLVHTLGAGIRGMNRAVDRLHGRTGVLDAIPVAGRTDRAIVSDALRSIGVEPSDGLVHELRDAYLACLPAELGRLAGDTTGVLPGVRARLSAMAGEPECLLGLLTGNFEAGAEMKLRHFGLWSRFRFGAFGDTHLDRRDLVPVALARAAEYSWDGPMSRVVVVGDTPLDVDCAHAHGAVAVGVATGQYSVDDLTHAGADLVLRTLDEWDRADAWLAAPRA